MLRAPTVHLGKCTGSFKPATLIRNCYPIPCLGHEPTHVVHSALVNLVSSKAGGREETLPVFKSF